MAIEPKRGCGYRKLHALYLVGTPLASPCGRLPLPLDVCPACGQGHKQSRGWTWVKPAMLFPSVLWSEEKSAGSGVSFVSKQRLEPCKGMADCADKCPLFDAARLGERAGMLWVGTKFYSSPATFMHEAKTLGVSKRIAALPRDFELGKTWVLLAHPRALEDYEEREMIAAGIPLVHVIYKPGVITAFQPVAVEKIVTETEAQDEKAMESLRKRGIRPVVVPDDDPDHWSDWEAGEHEIPELLPASE